MKLSNKKIIVPVMLITFVAGGFAALNIDKVVAYAGFGNDEMTGHLAEKLNLRTDQVSTAMDQIREEHQAQRKIEVSANLDKAVSDGVITADQKQQIIDKQVEMREQRGQHRAEMEEWATDNNIDFSKLSDYGIGKGMGGGHRGGMGMMR